MSEEADLIPIKKFAEKVSLSYTRARELAQSKELCDQGIAVNVNTDGRQGGMRIYWQAYLNYITKRPALPEHRRAREKMKVV